ncbi:DUF1684 domain-containing protein [Arthrobacter castelli]|uniref:DUF1684 domain-containing protein n=1 Tax=Arthrobacter castelli TaxID=271431 RepID=UPI000408E05B|nr:DUF1684 domain-containing protein [Arthrobacter castelli]
MSESVVPMPAADRRAFIQDWKAWHLTREATLSDPFGWLSVTDMHWLDTTARRFADIPGQWASTETGVWVQLPETEELFVDGGQVTGFHNFGALRERQSITVRTADFAVEIARRGGGDLIRSRRPDAPALKAFSGVPTFEPDPRWQLAGMFIPNRRPVTVASVLERVQHTYDSPGSLEFDLAGRTHRLTAFPGKEPNSFQVLFTDKTTGSATSALCRTMFVAPPASDGSVLLDFNRAVNMPCSFTRHATCPLPPPQNRLPFAVEAGEKEYVPGAAG